MASAKPALEREHSTHGDRVDAMRRFLGQDLAPGGGQMIGRLPLAARECLPTDGSDALLIGRAWVPADGGPSVIAVRGEHAVDLTRAYPTVSHLLNVARPAELRAAVRGAPPLGRLEEIAANSAEGHRNPSRPWLLAPCDLQTVKASGVTFVSSLLERVIEERAR